MIATEFSRRIPVDRLGLQEKTFDILAEPAEREALARRFGILAINSLSAQLRLSLAAGGALVRLKGRFAADVVQACVVTLEPVPAHIEEDFEMTYSTESEAEAAEVVIELDGDDPPEPIDDGVIDLGEAAAEHLALALDPFPRAPGAVFAGGEEASAEEREASPFAGLAALKKK